MIELDYYVYHIGRPGMSIDEGYIGISNNPERRWKAHLKADSRVGRAIRKYKDAVMTVIKVTTEERALEIEEQLRPEENLGWNLAQGGGMPPTFYGEDNPMRDPEIAKKLGEGRLGEKHHNFKGAILATSESGETFVLRGKREIKDHGFNMSHVYQCVNGRAKTHKGYTFKRKEVDDA